MVGESRNKANSAQQSCILRWCWAEIGNNLTALIEDEKHCFIWSYNIYSVTLLEAICLIFHTFKQVCLDTDKYFIPLSSPILSKSQDIRDLTIRYQEI